MDPTHPQTARDFALLADWQQRLPESDSTNRFLHDSTLRLVTQFTGQGIEPGPSDPGAEASGPVEHEMLGAWPSTESHSFALGALSTTDRQPTISFDELPTALGSDSLAGSFPELSMADLNTGDMSFSFSAHESSPPPATSMWYSSTEDSLSPSFSFSEESPISYHAIARAAGIEPPSRILPLPDRDSLIARDRGPARVRSTPIIVNQPDSFGGDGPGSTLPVSIEIVAMQVAKMTAATGNEVMPRVREVIERMIDDERSISFAKEAQRRACLRR